MSILATALPEHDDTPMLDDVARVLLVEDDDGIALPLTRMLEREQNTVTRTDHGGDALDHLREHPVDLVILDLGLPDMDGLDVCRQARADGFEGGILVVTARGSELDRVLGLDVGADDYLPKPFAVAELLARARALLRRTERTLTPVDDAPANGAGAQAQAGTDTGAGTPTASAGDTEKATPADTGALHVDAAARRVWVGSEEVQLTTKEFDVLRLLDAHAGAVVTREQLMSEVWDENWFGSTKTLDVTIARLRGKLEDAAAPAQVVTVRGVGFRLEPTAA